MLITGPFMSYTDNTASKINVTGCYSYYAYGAFDYAKDSSITQIIRAQRTKTNKKIRCIY